MADMRFLDSELTPLRLRTGFDVNPRFTILGWGSFFIDQSTYAANDKMYNEKCLLNFIGTLVDGGRRANMYIQILELFRGTQGIPRLLASFQHNDYMCIVTPIHGEQLDKLINHSNRKISYANGVRLAYGLFQLLNRLHDRGFVHRDVRLNTVRAGLSYNGEFCLQLHSFGYTAPTIPPPSSYGMQFWSHQSLPVNEGHPYTPIDDYIAALFTVMGTQIQFPFYETREKSVIQQKHEFEARPRIFLYNPNLEWIIKLYRELCNQRVNGIDKEAIMSQLNDAVPGCNPSSPFEWCIGIEEVPVEGGEPIMAEVVKLAENPVIANRPANPNPQPVVVPNL